MPYTPPGRNHRRSFTEESGPGAFAPMGALPKRASSKPTTPRIPKFQLRGNSEDSDEDEEQQQQEDLKIPFPSIPASPTLFQSASSPNIQTPSIYRSPYVSGRSSPPSTRRSVPLKPSLKSNHSSPHLPSLGAPHSRAITQSAPTTPRNHPSQLESGPSTPVDSCPPSPLPQTPKSVHFASEKSSLESVVVFNKNNRPRSLSTGGNDTETETEGYDSSTGLGLWSNNRYPFPVMPKQDTVMQIDEAASSQVPTPEMVGSGGQVPSGTQAMVLLETLTLPPTKPPAIKGSVLVRNVAFQKRVAVRFTLDDWQTTSEVSCSHSATLQVLPPPFSSISHADNGSVPPSNPLSIHSRSASLETTFAMGGKQESWDRFTFTIKLEDVERTLVNKKLFLVLKYNVPSQWGCEFGGEWWDNNLEKNYSVKFKLGKKPTPSTASPASSSNNVSSNGLLANPTAGSRLGAKYLMGSGMGFSSGATLEGSESKSNRTSSLPPLPPPGPIRPKITPPPLQVAPFLRQGRGPTFVDVTNSPPGSPRATAYTPPVPGAKPAMSPSGSLTDIPSLALNPPNPSPVPAPTKAQPSSYKSVSPGLTVSTGVPSLTSTVQAAPKKRLSLSNYASPDATHRSPALSTASLTIPALGKVTGTPLTQSPVSTNPPHHRKSASVNDVPSKDGDSNYGIKMIGGMPATIFEPQELRNSSERLLPSTPDKRSDSWDAMWDGFQVSGHLTAGDDDTNSTSDSDDKNSGLTMKTGQHRRVASSPVDGTAAESKKLLRGNFGVVPLMDSMDSNTTTPDLELSPQQPLEEVKPREDSSSESSSDDDTPQLPTNTVPFPVTSNSPTGDEFTRGRSTRIPSHEEEWYETPVAPPRKMSSLDQRTTQGRMRLDMPSVPSFSAGNGTTIAKSASTSSVPDLNQGSWVPPSRVPSDSAISTMSNGTGKNSRSPSVGPSTPSGISLRFQAAGQGPPTPGTEGPQTTLAGPPAEFLAKYCFFVSSPSGSSVSSLSPPLSTANIENNKVSSLAHGFPLNTGSPLVSPRPPNTKGSSAPIPVKKSGNRSNKPQRGPGASPSPSPPHESPAFTSLGTYSPPPSMSLSHMYFNGTGGVGIDTPRASSPGFALPSSNWWNSSTGAGANSGTGSSAGGFELSTYHNMGDSMVGSV